MNRSAAFAAFVGATLLALSGPASARSIGVDVWTDKGNEAVYQPGDAMKVKVRTSEDAYLIVYEIDSEGNVRLLLPYNGPVGEIEAHQTLEVPPSDANVQLVVEQQTGESYIVAIASADPFKPLPWYLRPYNPQAEDLGYAGAPDSLEDQGVTAEGKIVGDPFVAMERIRRTVIESPDSAGTFGTAYTTYYVHQAVRYPRYLCSDCHRPSQWAWWDGFDPYYTTCSVFSVHVNWGWYWGPGYWYGAVPYYVYSYRPDCPPRYHAWAVTGQYYSSWDGYNRWNTLWGPAGMRRYKSPPPPDYIGPGRWKAAPPGSPPGTNVPPGFLLADHQLRRGGGARWPTVVQPGIGTGGAGTTGPRTREGTAPPGTSRPPVERTPRGDGSTGSRDDGSHGSARPAPVYAPVRPADPAPPDRPSDPTPTPRDPSPGTPPSSPRQPGDARPPGSPGQPRASLLNPGAGWGRMAAERPAWARGPRMGDRFTQPGLSRNFGEPGGGLRRGEAGTFGRLGGGRAGAPRGEVRGVRTPPAPRGGGGGNWANHASRAAGGGFRSQAERR